ncbi:hypothetical protein Hanom_Chr13g01198581 [Helianthus anomalus]
MIKYQKKFGWIINNKIPKYLGDRLNPKEKKNILVTRPDKLNTHTTKPRKS